MDLLQKLYLQYLLTWKKCNFKEFVLIHLLPKEKKKKDLPVNSYIYRLARTRKNSQNNLLRTVWNMCNISVCLYAILRYVT